MKFQFLICCYFILFCTFQNTQAQEKKSSKDSVKVYKDIETYSKKNKFNRFIYRILFKSSSSKSSVRRNARKRFLIKKSFDKYEGRIIRNIIIQPLDPFGYSVEDEKVIPKKGFEKFGNKMHIRTLEWTISNLLLFKKNDRLDSLVAKESERLIRTQRSVRSVIIKPVAIPNSTDSVDISVRVLDSWSLIPSGSVSKNHTNLEITERNFLGLGHVFENHFSNRAGYSNNAYGLNYTINTIRDTYIRSTFIYENTIDNHITKSARVERQFFSPLTRLAGGVFVEKRIFNDSLPDDSRVFESQNFKIKKQEYWFGHSFNIISEPIEDFRTTNIVTSFGYNNVSYSEMPKLSLDPNRFFSSEKLFLTTLGISARRYAEDRYLFNFGIIEDVPYGQLYSLTAGFQDKNNIRRNYFSGRVAYGDYFPFGYLSLNLEWGSFFNKSTAEETTFRLEANYFTELLPFGRWKIRQFIKPTLIIGSNRVPIIKDRVLFTEENGIAGFGNPLISGTKKLVMAFQTQSYVPGNWYGFHFSPYVNITLGLLGNETEKYFSDKLYSKIGLGLLINNDYLVFNNFQISISYYPSIPYGSSHVFKLNTFKNSDLALPEFQIGQPVIVPFK